MHVRSTMLKKLFGLFGKSESMENTLVLYAPCDGTLLKLKDLPDEAFSSEMLGKGFAVEPTSDIIKSPIKANIVSVFPTKHALTLQADNAEILIHIGIDTVKLARAGFETLVKAGDTVELGQALVKIDFSALEAAGCAKSVILVVCNHNEFKDLSIQSKQQVTPSDKILIMKCIEAVR